MFLDRATGKTIWQMSESGSNLLVSHVAISNDIVYVLTESSELQARSIHNGELLGSLSFQPSLAEKNVNFSNNTFNLAASLDVVVVYFGHSKQLFAFRFSPS